MAELAELLELCKQRSIDKLREHLRRPSYQKCLKQPIPTENNTLLHYACCFGFSDVVLVLLEHGADPNLRNIRGESAMSFSEKFPEIKELLLAWSNHSSLGQHHMLAEDTFVGSNAQKASATLLGAGFTSDQPRCSPEKRNKEAGDDEGHQDESPTNVSISQPLLPLLRHTMTLHSDDVPLSQREDAAFPPRLELAVQDEYSYPSFSSIVLHTCSSGEELSDNPPPMTLFDDAESLDTSLFLVESSSGTSSASHSSASLQPSKLASSFGNLNTVDGIRNAFATNEEFSASEIVQILRFISPNPASPTASSSVSNEECKTLLVKILTRKRRDDVPSDSSHTLMIVWLFLTLQRMQVNETRRSQIFESQFELTQVISEDITEYMSTFLMRATSSQQFCFGKLQPKLAGLLLDRLLDLLQYSKDWRDYPFYIELPLWLLQVICLHLRVPSADEDTYEVLFNTDKTKHKRFVTKLLAKRDSPGLAPTLKSLPPDLVHNMLIGFLSPYMVQDSDITHKMLGDILKLFPVHDLSWFERFSLLFGEYLTASQMETDELRSWLGGCVEICKTNLKEADYVSGACCFVSRIMLHCLQHYPHVFKQMFYTTTILPGHWKSILLQSMKTLLSATTTPNFIARIPPDVINELSLQDHVIKYIAAFLENSDVFDDPVKAACEVLDELVVGNGMAVIDAFARGLFVPTRSAEDKRTLYISFSQLTHLCNHYDPSLTLGTHYDEVRAIFEKYDALLNLDLGVMNNNFSAFEENAVHNMEVGATRTISDFYCLLVKVAADLGVTNLTLDGTYKQMELLSKIKWRTDSLSLLRIYVSTCVLRVVLNSDDFSECVTMLDPGLFMYFQIEATDIREYHRWAIIEYMQEFRKFAAAFKKYLQDVFEQGQCSEAYLLKLQRTHVVLELAKICNLPDLPKYDIAKLAEKFHYTKIAIEELNALHTWFLAKGIKSKSTSSVYHNPDVTLRDMERQIRDYESQLVLDQTSLTLLKLLVLEKSTHLSIIVSKLHPEITTAMMVCDAQQLTQAMIDTRKYLANLLSSAALTLSTLEPHLETRQTFTADLKLIASYIPHKCTDLEARLTVLEHSLELLYFKHHLQILFACFKHFNFYFCDKPELKQFHAQLLRADYPVAISSVQLEHLHSLLGNFPAWFLSVFALIQDASPIVDFFCGLGENWQKKFDLLMAKQQGYQFGIEKLNVLASVRKLLEPFVKYRGTQRKLQINHFCMVVVKQFGVTPQNVKTHEDNLSSVLNELPEIQIWFSQLDGYKIEDVLPRIYSILQFGFYISSCTRKGAVLSVRKMDIDKEVQISEGEFQDLLRAKIFVDNVNVESHLKERVQKFLDCYVLATKVHSLHASLNSVGHPEYQLEDMRIPDAGPLGNDDAIRLQSKTIRDALAAWNKQLLELYSNAPRLLFLDQFQLAYFVQLLPLSLFLHVADFEGYLWMCFPDHPRSALSKVLAEMSTFNAPISAEVGLEIKLQAVGILVNLVSDKMTPLGQEANERRPPEVCLVLHQDAYFLHTLLSFLNNGSLHPATILSLSPTTTKRELLFFLKRVQKFPYVKYFLVSVNLLTLKLQVVLLKWTKHQLAMMGHLHLIFTTNAGTESFDFLQCKEYTPQNISIEHQRSYISLHKNVALLEYYTGDPGGGKTTYITQQLRVKNFKCTITVTANEDFSVDNFMKELRSNETHFKDEVQVRVGVHINISAFAPFQLINSFLYNFLVYGVLWNPESGRLEFAPPTAEWFVFIEVGQTSNTDKTLPHRHNTSQVLLLLPVLKQLGSPPPLTYLHGPMEPFTDANTSSSYIRHFCSEITTKSLNVDQFNELMNVNSIPSQLEKKEAWWKDMETLLTPQYCPTRRIYWDLFFKILAYRCMWLKFYSQHILHTVKENPNNQQIFPLRALFRFFLIEAYQLSEGGHNEPNLLVCFSLLHGKPTDITILNFGQKNTEGLPAISKAEAEKNPKSLYPALALYFGISENSPENMIEDQDFVLTPDFASKLFAMHTRLTVGHNVVLCGDTGTGKSKTMQIYSQIISRKYIPDIYERFRTFIRSLLLDDAQLRPRFPVFERILDFNGREWLPKFSATTQELIKVLDFMFDNAVSEFSSTLAFKVVQHIASMLRMYTLIKRTTHLARTVQFFQPEIFVLPNSNPEATDRLYGVRSRVELTQVVTEYLEAESHTLVHHVQMHYKLTAKEFSYKVVQIMEALQEAKKEESRAKMVVFVDDLSSTSIMGLLKEVFVDHTLSGQPLPHGLFWVGALNPNVSEGTHPDTTGSVLPPSMDLLTIPFRLYEVQGDESFLQCLFASMPLFVTESNTEKLPIIDTQKLIMQAQAFMRAGKVKPMVSIRDIMYVMRIYKFLSTSVAGEKVLALVADIGDNTDQPIERANWLSKHWRTLVISIALVYYFRLPTAPPAGQDRDSFATLVNAHLRVGRGLFLFEELLAALLNRFYSATTIPAGIAPTHSLKENIFCIAMCIEMNIPLVVVGPLGSTKTLAFSIVTNNMKGRRANLAPYTSFHSAHVFRYEFSEHLTRADLEQIYQKASDFQLSFAPSKAPGDGNRSVVLLNCAAPSEISIKALHTFLDHPTISSVLFSTSLSDVMRIGPHLQLRKSKISDADLFILAKECSGISDAPIIYALVEAFLATYSLQNTIFCLRDFVFFLRHLRLHAPLNPSQLTSTLLLDALLHNFNGIPRKQFYSLVELFFQKVGAAGAFSVPQTLYSSTYVDLIKQRLARADLSVKALDPYVPSSRHMMLIDPTDNETSLCLLFALGICDRQHTQICDVSDFVDDALDAVRSEAILKIKHAMEEGETIILVNSQSISHCFYDVFNCHYTVLAGGYKKYHKYARIAIGSHSHLCLVNDNFNLILHMPASELQSSFALLGRFEKYLISMDQAVQYSLSNSRPQVSGKLLNPELISTYVNRNSLLLLDHLQKLCGFVPEETIESLKYHFVNLTLRSKSSLMAGKTASSVGVDESEEDNTYQLQRVVRRANYQLLQITRPEQIYLSRTLLPVGYLNEYLTKQEHLSCVRFFHHAVTDAFAEPISQNARMKWCVFTRASGELLRLCSDLSLQKLMLPQQSKLALSQLKFLDLAAVKSASMCRKQVEEFATSNKFRVMICVANMSICTPKQVNFLRGLISSSLPHPCDSLITLILYYPQHTFPDYHTTFVHGWNFVYVDDFSEHNTVQNDLDMRAWVAKGFGLPIKITERASEQFKGCFLGYVKQCCSSLVLPKQVSTSLEFSKPFYNTDSPETRFAIFNQIFNAIPFILENIIKKFMDVWSGTLLATVLEEAWHKSVGLLTHMQSSLHKFLFPLAQQVVTVMSSNYALEGILEMQSLKGGDGFGQDSLLQLLLQAIPGSSSSSYLAPPTPSFDHQNPSCTILFDFISTRLQSLLSMAEEQLAQAGNDGAPYITLFSGFFSRLVATDGISPSLQFINASPSLTHSFKVDCYSRTLQLSGITNIWINAIDGFFIKFAHDLGIRTNSPIMDFFLVLHLQRELVLNFSTLVRPLLLLRHPSELINNIARTDRCIRTWEQLNSFLWKEIIPEMWSRILDSETELVNWLAVFQLLHHLAPHHSSLLGIVTHSCVLQWDLLTVWAFFLTTFSYRIQLATSRLVGKISLLTEYKGLQSLIGLVTHFSDLVSSDPRKQTFLQEVLRYFLLVPENSHYSEIQCSAVHANLNYFIGLCLETKVESAEAKLFEFTTLQKFWIIYNHCTTTCSTLQDQLVRTAVSQSMAEKQNFHFPQFQYFKSVKQNSILSDAVFFSLLRKYSKQHEHLMLDELCPLYLSNSGSHNYLHRAAVATIILQRLASLFTTELALSTTEKSVIRKILENLDNNNLDRIPLVGEREKKRNLTGMYLLHLLPRESIVSVLQSNYWVDALQLDKWRLADDKDTSAPHYRFLPFMVEAETELGKSFHELLETIQHGQPKSVWKKICQMINAGGPQLDKISYLKYQTRMFIVLICYYFFFNSDKSCEPILALLNKPKFTKLLNIDDKEKLVFKFLASTPIQTSGNAVHTLEFQFSSQARIGYASCTIAQIMVNCVAIALGTPKDSNHLYPRIFEVQQMATTCGPGSALERKQNMDTGYTFTSDGQLPPNDKIMDDHTPSRLVLNITIWASLAWVCIIGSPSTLQGVPDLLTLWKKDLGFLDQYRFGHDKIKSYIRDLIHKSYDLLCKNEELVSKNVVGQHFINESLFQMWKEIFDKRPVRLPGWQSLYPTPQDATKYEQVMKARVFDIVLSNYMKLKVPYQVARNTHLREVIAIQQLNAQRFSSPLLSLHDLSTYLHASLAWEDASVSRPTLEFLSYFFQNLTKIHALKRLPALVRFYRYLHTTLAHKVSRTDAHDKAAPVCIARFAPHIKALEDEWEPFKLAWQEIRAAYRNEIPSMDEKTTFYSLLCIAQNEDPIFSLILRLVNLQETVLDKYNQMKHKPPPRSYIGAVSFYEVRDMFVMGAYTPSEVEQLIMPHMSLDEQFTKESLHFDLERIALLISEKFMCNKPIFYTTGFQIPFIFLDPAKRTHEKQSSQTSYDRDFEEKLANTHHDLALRASVYEEQLPSPLPHLASLTATSGTPTSPPMISSSSESISPSLPPPISLSPGSESPTQQKASPMLSTSALLPSLSPSLEDSTQLERQIRDSGALSQMSRMALSPSSSPIPTLPAKKCVINYKEKQIARLVLSPAVTGSKLYSSVKKTKKVPAPFYLLREETNEILPNSSAPVNNHTVPSHTTIHVRPGTPLSLLFRITNQSSWPLLQEPFSTTASLYGKVSAYTSLPLASFTLHHQSTIIPNSSTPLESYFAEAARSLIEISVHCEICIRILSPGNPTLEFIELANSPISLLYEKVAEYFTTSFYLSPDKTTVLPSTSTTCIHSLLQPESAVISLHLIAMDSVKLLEIFNHHTRNNLNNLNESTFHCLPTDSSTSHLHDHISSFYYLPEGSFALVTTDSTILSPDSPTPIHQLPQADQHTALYVIDKNDLLTVTVHCPSREPLVFVELKSSTLSAIFSKISPLSPLPDSPYFSQYPPQLIPSADYTLPLSHLVDDESNITLHVIDTKAVTLVYASSDNQLLLLGLPRGATTYQMWQEIAKHFPNSVCFAQGAHWTEIPTNDDDSETVSAIAISGQVTVEVLPVNRTLLVSIAADETDVPTYIHPDLVVCDMFANFLAQSDQRRYKFVGPTGNELGEDDWRLRVVDYVAKNNIHQGNERLVFRVVRDLRIEITAVFCEFVYKFEADDVAQITTSWILTSLSRANGEISEATSAVCSATGIVLEEENLALYIRANTSFVIASQADLIHIDLCISETEYFSIAITPSTTSADLAEFCNLPLPLFCSSGLSIPPSLPLSHSFKNEGSKQIEVTVGNQEEDGGGERVLWWGETNASVQVLMESFPSALCLEYARYIFGIQPDIPLVLRDKDGFEFEEDTIEDVDIYVVVQSDETDV